MVRRINGINGVCLHTACVHKGLRHIAKNTPQGCERGLLETIKCYIKSQNNILVVNGTMSAHHLGQSIPGYFLNDN